MVRVSQKVFTAYVGINYVLANISVMGFRKLLEFNLSILGKNGWRLLTNTNSSVARGY